MDFDKTVLVLENRIIDFFTMITWWTEVKFEKTNVNIAVAISTLSSLSFCSGMFIEQLKLYEKGSMFWFVLGSIVGFFSVLSFFAKATFSDVFKEVLIKVNPQGSPNPCRISKRHSFSRRYDFILIVVLAYSSFVENLSFLFLLYAVCEQLCNFFLACDSIPPAEKNRRKVLSEMGQLKTESSGV